MDRREFLTGLGSLIVFPDFFFAPAAFHVQPLYSDRFRLAHVDKKTVTLVADAIEAVYKGKVSIQHPRPIPDDAFYTPRNRYRTVPTCEYLASLELPGLTIGVTGVDISQPNGEIPDWGVFGVAHERKKSALLSTFRVRENVEHRLQIIASHEVGHLYGLDHCEEHACTMRDLDGNGARLDTIALGSFCPMHYEQLESALQKNG